MNKIIFALLIFLFIGACLIFFFKGYLHPKNEIQESLVRAIENGNTQEVRSLISNLRDVNQAMANGATLLLVAAEKGELEVVKILLEKEQM